MFRFTIRELVLLTLIVAMGVGWWIDRRPRPGVSVRLRTNDIYVGGSMYDENIQPNFREFIEERRWRVPITPQGRSLAAGQNSSPDEKLTSPAELP